MKPCCYLLIYCSALLLSACNGVWNNPYPKSDNKEKIYYDSFRERPKHLDPASSYSSNEYVFLGQIYEPVLQYHFLKRPYQLTTLTAKSLPQVEYFDANGNPLPSEATAERVAKAVYTISIKPDILYQPHPALAKDDVGNYLYHQLTKDDLSHIHTLADFDITGTRELTAEDYVYQIKRMANPKLHAPIAGLMMKYIDGLNTLQTELTEFYESHPGQKADLREFDISGVEVIDRYTYQIILKEKYPQFVYWLSMYFFSPMPWEADVFYGQPGMKQRNITLDWYPIGTGPFMLTENNPNLRMVMVKNPNFHQELYPAEGDEFDRANGLLDDAGTPLPFIDKAIYSLEKESIPSWNKFLQGYFDTSSIISDSFDQAVRVSEAGEPELTEAMIQREIKLNTAITTSTFYMGFNMVDDVVGGDSQRARLLRRAISIAIDHEEYISIFANGRGIASQGPIPPGIFGYQADEQGINPYVYDWVDGKPKRKSIAEARSLLEQAGYKNGRDQKTGKPLILYFDALQSMSSAKAFFDWMRKQLKKLDINLVVRATDYNRFQEKMLKGTSQIFFWGWNADYPDPENFLFLLYGPNAKFEKNGENAANYQNSEFDKLFNQMKSMSNSDARQQIVDQMMEIARRDAPWIWGYHPVGYVLHHNWYKNAKPNLMANNTLKYKRIDNVLRTELRQKWNQAVWWPIAVLIILIILSLVPAYRTYKQRQQARLT